MFIGKYQFIIAAAVESFNGEKSEESQRVVVDDAVEKRGTQKLSVETDYILSPTIRSADPVRDMLK